MIQVTVTPSIAGAISLRSDGDGRWWKETGEPLAALAGCLDVDFSATPFTNTLPIRRLGLQPGESTEIAVVYIDAPSLDVVSIRQRYTCLDRDASSGRYRFEALP
jgi:hypothetical protein